MVRVILAALFVFTSSSVFALERVSYFHNDQLGSPVAISRAGQHLYLNEYYSYGKAYRVAGMPEKEIVGYSGHVQDSDTLVYMGARYYDADVARFFSMDPIGVLTGQHQHVNGYWYANASPYGYVDPDGKDPLSAFIFGSALMLHWGRNSFNEPYSETFVERGDISSTHQLGGQIDNIKHLSEDGRSEYVINRVTGNIVTDPKNEGTFNGIRAQRAEDNVIQKIAFGIGHTLVDVVPWVPFGNKPHDISLESNPITRVAGLLKAGGDKVVQVFTANGQGVNSSSQGESSVE